MAAKKKTASEPEKMSVKSKTAVASSAASSGTTSAEKVTVSAAEAQLRRYEEAYRLFRAQDYAQAKTAFELAIEGPQRELTHNARLHVAMCERRLQSAPAEFTTAEENYNYAIARLNARELPSARRYFDAAFAMAPNGDHILYGLALCCGLAGDYQGCYENLKRAIDLQPKNRLIARQDPDFNTIVQHPVFHQLLYEK
jgi:tetratricopeptide (TPR) repeat protein